MDRNKLFYGDNLAVLRDHIGDESIDLIYLDPPFNSNATYNVLYQEKSGEQSPAQIRAFEDSWEWDSKAAETYHEIVTSASANISDLIQALHKLLVGQSGRGNDLMAYLVMMTIRLVELHRVLKSTGNLFLHCDPTASHFLKLVLDSVFGPKNLRNEIIWCYRQGGRSQNTFAKKHDTIFWYSKTDDYYFDPDPVRVPYEGTGGYQTSGKGVTHKATGKTYLPNPKGKVPEDWWDIPALAPMSSERLSYPTQKPEKLLERIILSASKDDHLVLDPFCGCGTTLVVAERYHRNWIGIDITHLAVSLMKGRLESAFGEELSPFEVHGSPVDLPSAKALSGLDKSEFENWAVGLVENAIPYKLQGPDGGIDGFINFLDDDSGQAKKVLLQVKSGNVGVKDIRDFRGTMEREESPIGAFLTLKDPTSPMKQEAAMAGFYIPEHFTDRKYQRIQIMTIEDLLDGKTVSYPRLGIDTFKKAKRQAKHSNDLELDF